MDWLGDLLFGWVFDLLYILQKSICVVIDFIVGTFYKLSGLDTVSVGGRETDLLTYFLQTKAVHTAFLGVFLVGIVLLFTFVMLSIIKSESADAQHKRTKGQIITKASQSFVFFLVIPFLLLAGIMLTNVIMGAINGSMTASVSSGETLFGGQILVTSGYGSVYQLPNGKWRCQINLGHNEDGTRNRPTKIFNTEAEAVAWNIKQLATIQEYGRESIQNTNELFVFRYHKWLVNIKMAEVESLTFKRLTDSYNKHIKPYFLNNKQKELLSDDFQRFFKKLETDGVGVESRRKIKNTLRQYFEFEYKNTPMRNPVSDVKIVTKKKVQIFNPNDNPDDILNQNEYKAVPKEIRKKFLDALDKEKNSPFLKPLCYLMYFTGNRVGETIPYQWKDFNFEKRYFTVYKAVSIAYEFDDDGNQIGGSKTIVKPPKSKDGVRPLPLYDILYEALMEWKEYRKAQEKITGISFTAPNDYIFATNKGEMRSRWGTNTVFSRFLKRHGLKDCGIHFHALRQTCSNMLFEEDTEGQTVADILGHADPSTSKKHYNRRDKFDSVQKAAQIQNTKFKPKDPKYCADDNVTFAPTGFIKEKESGLTTTLPKKRPLSEMLRELSDYPEFKGLLELMRMSNEKPDIEM